MKQILIFIVLVSTSFLAQSQTINTADSKVEFEVSNFKFNTVEGSLSDLNGTVKFNKNAANEAYFKVCVPVNTIQTGIEKRDEHLLTADFFDADNYPNLCFESQSVTQTASGYLAKGILTIRGVSKQIELPFKVQNNALVGSFTINRFDYNVGADTGTLTVGSEVEVSIYCALSY